MRAIEFLLTVVFAAGLAIGLAMTPSAELWWEFWGARFSFGIAFLALFAAYGVWLHETSSKSKPLVAIGRKIMLGGLVAITSTIGIPASFYWVDAREKLAQRKTEFHVTEPNSKISSSASPSSVFFAECSMESMPLKIPVSGVIYAIGVFLRKEDTFPRGGIGKHFGPPGSDIRWSISSLSTEAYKCSLTNYGQVPFLDVDMYLTISVFNTTLDTDKNGAQGSGIEYVRGWLVHLDRVEAGKDNPFIFYIYNGIDKFVNVNMPDVIKAKKLGDSIKSDINVDHPAPDFMALSPRLDQPTGLPAADRPSPAPPGSPEKK